ncbi:ATP-binding protein [Chitinimonas sp.]|uniref:ATP-binding protein n=1 Tax=Chitinimonas sp. TaxID=1934313 RepID=UPI002F925A86
MSELVMGWRYWPRTMFMRLGLVFFVGLLLANALTYVLIMAERRAATVDMMLGYLEKDVASSVALLDRLPAAERPAWLPRLERRTYRFELGPGLAGGVPDTTLSSRVAASFAAAVGQHYPITASKVPGSRDRVQAHLRLSDGSQLTVDMQPMPLPISAWLPVVLGLQLLLIAAVVWLGVRLITRPLVEMAQVADALGPDLQAERLDETGSIEVVRAARAFNAMQDRIKQYMTERMQILAAISHDLQTPITRMRMRADMLDEPELRHKLNQDLAEMQALVREGVTFARTLHGNTEPATRIDPDALLSSLVYDYQDAGQPVELEGQLGTALVTRPQAFKRVLSNLIDNGLKYAGAVAVEARFDEGGATIHIRDNGPGIPEEQLEAVFQPFYRLEGSRNRDTGGTGLGLAIARQLSLAMNATLTLHNRPEGGLEARLRFKSLPERAPPG